MNFDIKKILNLTILDDVEIVDKKCDYVSKKI